MRRLLTRLRTLARPRVAVPAGAAALALVVVGGVLGRGGTTPAEHPARTVVAPADLLAQSIAKQQQRLRQVPGDWQTWAALAASYVSQARISADPTYYPRAQGAAQQSLVHRPTDNADAYIALGALANARHDFAAARDDANKALAANPYSSDAYGVLTDALTQLGDSTGATAAVQHMLDLKPGLAAFSRASYDLEQRGRVDAAADMMRRALADAVDRSDVAFCQAQTGDLAWQVGDVAGAAKDYADALAADPTSVAGLRGRARTEEAGGRTAAALADWAELNRRTPTVLDLLEYADLLRASGKPAQADQQVQLAAAAQALFTANGGVDGIGSAAIDLAQNKPDDAVAAARAEWGRRQFVDVADALAWALHRDGRDTEALTYAQKVAATGARAPGYAYHLGMIELALGQRDQAKRDLTRAVQTNPTWSPVDAPAARQAIDKLAATR